MPLLTSPIPNLIGGISQQPPAIRTSSEAQDILNAVPSAVEGLTKRPPSEFVFAITDSSNIPVTFSVGAPPFIHVIERDKDEKYFLTIANNGTIYVNDVDGTKKTVFIHSTGNHGTHTVGQAKPSERSALTIGDVTFIANQNTIVGNSGTTKTQNPPNYLRAGILWVRQSNYGRTHTATIGGVSFSHTSMQATIKAAGNGGTAGLYTNVQLTFVSSTTATVWETYPKATVNIDSTGKVADITITTPGTVPLNGGDVLLTTTIGGLANFRLQYEPLVSGDIGTLLVTKALFDGTGGAYVGPRGGIVAMFDASTRQGNTIYLGSTSYNFSVSVQDDFSGLGVTFIRDKVDRLEDLPPVAPQGYMVKVTGSGATGKDDYWVQFDAEDTVFSDGIWYECSAPGEFNSFNVSTMPVLLIRQSNGTFLLKYADGSTPATGSGQPSPTGANYAQYIWRSRLAGDNETNDFPTFKGYGITNMIYHQGRLGLMSKDNIIFSETSEFFNFFRTTVIDLLDTDPIDIASSTPRVGSITAAIQFNRDVVLFTPTSQMILRGGDVLSPKSVALAPAAEFENLSATVRPFASANSIFFTYSNGGFAGVRELVPQVALDGAYYANDLTNNVPRLIPNSVTHLTATTHDNIAMVVSGGHLYGYRYFTSGSEKLQSAWFRFRIADRNYNNYTGYTTKVLWCQFINSDLYIGMYRSKGTGSSQYFVIEKMRMGAGINDVAYTSTESITYLDQRQIISGDAGTYDSTTNLTTYNLPKPMSYDAINFKAITVDGYVLKCVSGTPYIVTGSVAGTVSILGDHTNTTYLWFGFSYDMKYVFSTPYLKGQAGRGVSSITSGRYQLRYLNLQYAETGYFRVVVDVKNEDSYEYIYTGLTLGTDTLDTPQADSGTFRVPLFSKNDNITITLINDTHRPSKILSGELEAFYNDRSQRTPQ